MSDGGSAVDPEPDRRQIPRTKGPAFERSRSAAALVALGILLSRISGLVRQVMMARYLGTSIAADAFNAAFRIPNLLQNLFGEGVLSASFIPEYAGLLGRDEEEKATHLAGAVLGMLALITSIIVLIGVLGAPYLVALIANGFTGEKRELTIRLTRILFPGAGLLVFSAWCLGILNSHRKFFMSYAAPVLWNVAMVAALIGFHSGRSQVQLALILAFASVVGSALQCAVQLPLVLTLARGLRLRITMEAQSVRNVFRNFIPAFIGRGVVQLSAYVDAWLASYLGNGAVSSFTYAQAIYVLPVSLFGMAISAAELPAMSRAVGTDEEIAAYLRSRLDAGLERIAFFIVPSAIALFALGDLIGYLLLQSGVWHKSDTIWVWQILAGSAIGLLASTMGRLYSSTFYALRDTRTPLRFAVIRVILTTALGYFAALVLPGMLGLDPKIGAAGLTASAGIAGWIEFLLLRHALTKRIGATGLSKVMALRLWIAAALAASVPWMYKALGYTVQPKLVSFALLVVYGLLYFAFTAVQGIPEAREMSGRLSRLIRRSGKPAAP